MEIWKTNKEKKISKNHRYREQIDQWLPGGEKHCGVGKISEEGQLFGDEW